MTKKAVMLLRDFAESVPEKWGKLHIDNFLWILVALLHFGFGMAAGCFEVSLLASDKNNAHQHSVQEFSTFEIGIFSDS